MEEKEIILTSKLEKDIIYLNNIYKDGLRIKYLEEIEGDKISSDVKRYLIKVAKKEIENKLNLEKDMLKFYLRLIDFKHFRNDSFLSYRNKKEDLRDKKISEEEFEEYIDKLNKTYTNYKVINIGLNSIFSQKSSTCVETEIFNDRKREGDKRFEVVFNEREYKIIEEILNTRKVNFKRKLGMTKKTYKADEKRELIAMNSTYRDLFLEHALHLKYFHQARYLRLYNAKYFTQEEYKEMIKDRNKEAYGVINFRVCKRTMMLINEISDDKLKDIEKFKFFLYHLMTTRYVSNDLEFGCTLSDSRKIRRTIPLLDKDVNEDEISDENINF